MDKKFLNDLLTKSQAFNASDIHLSSGLPPYMRIQGDIVPMQGFEALSAKNILDIASSIMDAYFQEILMRNLQVDFAYYNEQNKTRYRVNAFKNNRGISIALRQLNSKIPQLEETGFPEIFKRIASMEKGLVLVCGPTGSGKSTTLAILLDYINRHSKRHIITLEDPIEYVFETKTSLVEQREVGKSVRSFTDGLVGALREDPDVIMIGEMRDRETIKMALTAAETGHLVLSTLHTMSASKTIDRIIDSSDPNEKEVIKNMLSTSLQAIILQTLLKNHDNTNRVAAFEIVVGTGAIRNMIRENKIYQIDSMIQTGSKFGMVTMEDYVENLIRNGVVNKEEALARISKIEKETK